MSETFHEVTVTQCLNPFLTFNILTKISIQRGQNKLYWQETVRITEVSNSERWKLTVVTVQTYNVFLNNVARPTANGSILTPTII